MVSETKRTLSEPSGQVGEQVATRIEDRVLFAKKRSLLEELREAPRTPWIMASEYPGLLPESLTRRPNEAVLMWKRDEEERRERAEEEVRIQEEAARRAAEEAKIRAAKEARRAKQIEIGKALREAALAKGTLKERDRCPKCGFSYAWDGMGCYHCDFRKDEQP
jgi:hypothetical protein